MWLQVVLCPRKGDPLETAVNVPAALASAAAFGG